MFRTEWLIFRKTVVTSTGMVKCLHVWYTLVQQSMVLSGSSSSNNNKVKHK